MTSGDQTAPASPADNATLSAAEIVAQLDLDTRISLVSGDGFWWLQSLEQFGLSKIMVADGPHGLRQQGGAGDHLGLAAAVQSTCFPTAVTLASSWDPELVEAVGVALGEEAREQGVAVVLGPGINIKRHPAGGRCFEYYSEDPLLGGKLAAAFVRGVQSTGIGTSLKHYAVNNQETFRLVVDAVVDERTLRELYLSGFETVIKEAQPWTVMCSYNLVNGTYASEHHELLTTILRDEWGFDGLVVSDWGATNDRVAGLRAGLDLEMPGSNGAFDAEIAAALGDGRLGEDELNRCAERVVRLVQQGQWSGERPSSDRRAHHALARRAAAEGSVLLRNDGILPLQLGIADESGDAIGADGSVGSIAVDGSVGAIGSIAVIGAFAEHPRYQGAGSSQVTPTQLDNALDALRSRVGDAATVTYAPGFDAKSGDSSAELLAEAVSNAEAADVAVVFAGLPAPKESEGFDRSTLDLPDGEVRLIEAVAATGTPVVVFLNNGGVVRLPWAERVNALVESWLGGQAGGPAMVDVLFGDVAPEGRLPESIPHHQAQLAADRNFPGEPRQVQYREGLFVGYRFHDSADVPAHFAFGHGLSYTSFSWGEPTVAGSGTDLTVSLSVTNIGDRAGADVVQLYVRDRISTLRRPAQELKAFAKVRLEPGETRTIELTLDRRCFAVWDVAAHDWLVESGEFDLVLARSSADPHAVVTITIDSDDIITPVPTPAGLVATTREFEALFGGPIPAVVPARPFHRNSTLGEMEGTKVGDALIGLILKEGVKRARQEFPDPDEATIAMVESSLREGPLRGLVLMGGGVMRFEALDGIIDTLNRNWSGVIDRAKRVLKR
ncbi:MAG: glycosyl hydrolase [Actinobacteria bacterium]|nr:glycosyl hydrolase [Actinomycetota bacterium]